MNKSKLSQIERILTRKIYTPKQLVELGIYGCKSSVHHSISRGEIEAIWITDRRIVILTESVISHLRRDPKNFD